MRGNSLTPIYFFLFSKHPEASQKGKIQLSYSSYN